MRIMLDLSVKRGEFKQCMTISMVDFYNDPWWCFLRFLHDMLPSRPWLRYYLRKAFVCTSHGFYILQDILCRGKTKNRIQKPKPDITDRASFLVRSQWEVGSPDHDSFLISGSTCAKSTCIMRLFSVRVDLNYYYIIIYTKGSLCFFSGSTLAYNIIAIYNTAVILSRLELYTSLYNN